MEQAAHKVRPEKEVKEQVLQSAGIACLNCGEILTGKYCNECGQSSATSRLSLHEILVNLWHSITETDIGLLHLIKELAYRPGHVTREYISGKRKKYYNPFSFLLITTAAYVYVAVSSGYMKTIMQTNYYMPQNDKSKQIGQQITFIFENYTKEISFLFIPVLAAITWLFFRKSKVNYAENLVFQSYIYGQMAVAFFVLVLPFMLYPKWLPVANIMYTFWMLGYFLLGLKQLFQNNWLKTILKGTLIYTFNFVLMVSVITAYVVAIHILNKP